MIFTGETLNKQYCFKPIKLQADDIYDETSIENG
jgi:hypothetical protein